MGLGDDDVSLSIEPRTILRNILTNREKRKRGNSCRNIFFLLRKGAAQAVDEPIRGMMLLLFGERKGKHFHAVCAKMFSARSRF